MSHLQINGCHAGHGAFPINDLELRYILQNALTSETDDCGVIFHGFDQFTISKATKPEQTL